MYPIGIILKVYFLQTNININIHWIQTILITFNGRSFKLLQNLTWLPLDYLWLMPIKYSVTGNVTSNECIADNG